MENQRSLNNLSVHSLCSQFILIWSRPRCWSLAGEHQNRAESAVYAELKTCGLKIYDGFTEMMMPFCQIIARSGLLFQRVFWGLFLSVLLPLAMSWNFLETESVWRSTELTSSEFCYENLWCQEITRDVSTPAYKKDIFLLHHYMWIMRGSMFPFLCVFTWSF